MNGTEQNKKQKTKPKKKKKKKKKSDVVKKIQEKNIIWNKALSESWRWFKLHVFW